MDSTIITTIITAVTTLVVSIGTWHFSAKASRKKDMEEIQKMIESYRDELRAKFTSVQNSVTGLDSSMQQKIVVIDCKIDNLSEKVERHNGVVERTYALEKTAEVQAEQIRVANHRIEDLERTQHDA